MANRAALALLLLNGCVAYDHGATVETPTARELFERDVYPVLSNRCAGCHSSGDAAMAFMLTDASTTYDRIVRDPALVDSFTSSAPILLMRGHPAVPGYTPLESAAILTWLDAEAAERR